MPAISAPMHWRNLTLALLAGARLALWPVPVLGQEAPFLRVGAEAGLSHNSVYAITEDAEGFLWIGTVDGLNRYDGYEFRVYRHDPGDTASLSNNQVNALLADSTGDLWAATADGLNRFEPRLDGFRRYRLVQGSPPGVSNAVHALHRDPDGALWAGGDAGLYRYDAAADRFDLVSGEVPANRAETRRVVAIRDGVDGSLWVLSGATGVWVLRQLRGAAPPHRPSPAGPMARPELR